jgi:hypothetical protein
MSEVESKCEYVLLYVQSTCRRYASSAGRDLTHESIKVQSIKKSKIAQSKHSVLSAGRDLTHKSIKVQSIKKSKIAQSKHSVLSAGRDLTHESIKVQSIKKSKIAQSKHSGDVGGEGWI